MQIYVLLTKVTIANLSLLNIMISFSYQLELSRGRKSQ